MTETNELRVLLVTLHSRY